MIETETSKENPNNEFDTARGLMYGSIASGYLWLAILVLVAWLL